MRLSFKAVVIVAGFCLSLTACAHWWRTDQPQGRVACIGVNGSCSCGADCGVCKNGGTTCSDKASDVKACCPTAHLSAGPDTKFALTLGDKRIIDDFHVRREVRPLNSDVTILTRCLHLPSESFVISNARLAPGRRGRQYLYITASAGDKNIEWVIDVKTGSTEQKTL